MSKATTAATAQVGTSPALRKYLYFTATCTGAAILIVEILGAKMLSPFVGTSHFVWTAQIAVTLVALACGYYFGGWLVDRSTKLSRLYFCIAAAAAYLALGILIVEPVTYQFLELNLAAGALAASTVLFFIPLTLLAAVGPFLIRVLAQSFSGIGSQVGRLSALSTLGSVAGTLLIGYVLIPFMPNSVTMFVTAGALFLICIAYFVVWGRENLAPLALLIVAGLGFGALGIRRDLNPVLHNVTELYRQNSDFGMLQVIQTKNAPRRFYLNDFLVQNSYDPEAKKSLTLFTYMLRYLTQGYTTNLQDVLCIGLGVGVVPMELAVAGANVDVVEINPEVVEVGRRFFDLDPARMNIVIGDGRFYLNQSKKKYDAVILDAFLGDSSPSHLMSKEAFENMHRLLKPGGVLVINSFGDFRAGQNFFTGSLDKTLKSVFASVRIHGTGSGNVFFAASDQPEMKLENVSTADAHPELLNDINICLNSDLRVDPEAGIVLTDDFNPVEFYDAENREKHRRRLAFAVRRL